MAQATKVIRKMPVDVEAVRKEELREIEDKLIEHKDTLDNLFRLLDQLDEHELFNALNAGLAKSDPILTRVLKAVNETETDKAIRNALLLVEGLGKFKLDEVEPMILKFNKGLKLATEYDHNEPQGWIGLFSVLTNKDFIEGSRILTKFVKGFGTALPQLKEEQGIIDSVETDAGEPDNKTAIGHYPTKKEHNKEKSFRPNSNLKYLGLAAGAAAISVSALLLKK